MAKFFVGQRVRYANPQMKASKHRGKVGIVHSFHEEWKSWDGYGLLSDCKVTFLDIGTHNVHTMELEPILDRHEPCESEFKESLDKLLSEVTCADVK